MGFLSYIAESLIAPNLTGYFLSKGLTNREENKLVNEIKDKVIEFNRKYDDKEVDSSYFVDFLEQKDITNDIITRVFNTYKSSGEDYSELAKKLSYEAVEFVNIKKDKFNHPHVKNKYDFENYFYDLFKILIDFRESLLNTKDKSMLSIMDESIGKSEEKVISTINERLGENYLLEEKIKDIDFIIDKGLYGSALETISELFETMGDISKEQRVKLLYQKAKIYVNTDQIEKIDDIKRRIQHNCPNSKFIDEIDYLIGCINKDEKIVVSAIKKLKDKGESEVQLLLKESNFKLYIEDFDAVKGLVLDEYGNIKSDLKNEASVFSQLGLINLFGNEFEKAALYFDEALKVKYSIHDDYHSNIAKAFIFGMNLSKSSFNISEDIKKKAIEICNNLERTYYFIKDSSKEIRLQHWCQYLSIMGIYDTELAIEKFKEIDSDLVYEYQIHIVMSEIYFFNEDYKNAMNYYKSIWDKESTFLIRMLYCCEKLNDWVEIEKIFRKNIDRLFDKQGIVLFYKIRLFDKLNKVEDVKKLIVNEGKNYKCSSWFVKNILEFSYDKDMDDIYDIFLDYVLKLSEKIELDERVNLGITLYNHKKYNILRELISNSIRVDDRALELYLLSYGEVNRHNDQFYELQEIVNSFYNNGNRSKYLLQVKFYIEFFTKRYNDSINSILEYKNNHGDDIFYKINLIQCITLGGLDYDASEEVKKLLETNELKNHIIVSQYFAYKGRWDDAKSLLKNAYYRYEDQIKEEELIGFLSIHFNNIYQERGAVEYDQICDNSTSILKDDNGNIKNISIHTNDEIVEENGEFKFESINFKSSSDYSLMLKAIGKKGNKVELDGVEYTVLEILDIHTYLFRYFLQKMQDDYPNNKAIITISGETIEEMIDKITGYMQESTVGIKKKLDNYNFGIMTGTPISYLSGKDTSRYLSTIYFLLNNEEQCLYSTYSNSVDKGNKYVITISSLVILNLLGYLDRIKSISDKLFIPPSIKTFVRRGISDAIKYDSVVSIAFLDDNNKLVMEESSEESKEFIRKFWTQILMAIKDFKEVNPGVINTEYYDKSHEFIDISEFEAISISSDEEAVLVCDDLFISKVGNSINNNINIINIIELLYKEEIITIDELIKLLNDLTKKKYINCINHYMLFDIYIYLLNSYNTPNITDIYLQVSEIFENLFDSNLGINNNYLYSNFIELVTINKKINLVLYKLLEKPLGFKPFNELLSSIMHKN